MLATKISLQFSQDTQNSNLTTLPNFFRKSEFFLSNFNKDFVRNIPQKISFCSKRSSRHVEAVLTTFVKNFRYKFRNVCLNQSPKTSIEILFVSRIFFSQKSSCGQPECSFAEPAEKWCQKVRRFRLTVQKRLGKDNFSFNFH